ncbi:RNA-binding S4 domain-containing protein [Flocculibacter collagenilyticus]|uniref:RNA-binding S4 domain-containing protein n=1 Tax=Flocculibacter collagenilyticus TaxID=2744479 RepID=UPI0018F30C77|nr:RNA-binding S4 domain-containing protein [Flocculibacter collagenilyticus]
MTDTTKVEIHTDYIELNKLLKFEAIVASGAEAKQVISAKMVIVNGQIVEQTRKKVFPGDIVEVQGQLLEVVAQTAS